MAKYKYDGVTVKELIELLSKHDPNLEVILQRDPEGNGYSPASAGAEACHFEDGEIADREDGEEINAVVLWPIY